MPIDATDIVTAADHHHKAGYLQHTAQHAAHQWQHLPSGDLGYLIAAIVIVLLLAYVASRPSQRRSL